MKINWLSIENYKGFNRETIVELAPKVNVIVGGNSSGKTALLECINFENITHKPHKNPINPINTITSPHSVIKYNVTISGEELLNYGIRNGQKLNLPQALIPKAHGANYLEKFAKGNLEINTQIRPQTQPIFHKTTGTLRGNSVSLTERNVQEHFKLNEGRTGYSQAGSTNSASNSIEILAEGVARADIFYFDAERFRVGRCSSGEIREMKSDASNLPICLADLDRNRVRFDKYVQLVRRVLPQIKNISVGPIKGNHAEVEILIYSVETDREDLGIPLNDCGTGVAQTLAILYIIYTRPNSIIIIDEPNSFLHPSASKNLMHVINESTDIQFVISTHSGEVIATLSPDEIISITWDQEKNCSKVNIDDAKSLSTRRDIMLSLGIAYSDVFGSEVAIWVEGETEVVCYNKIIDLYLDGRPAGVEFISMPWASAIDAKHRDIKEFFDLHRKVTQSSALWPPSIAFAFDSELRSDANKEEIKKESSNKALFLPRRMIENYFCEPKAITALIQHIESGSTVDEQKVSDWLEANKSDEKYLDDEKAKQNPEGFCNAGKLLCDLISQLTECRYEYKKVPHGLWIIEWLIENNTDALTELKDYVFSLYEIAKQP